MKKLATLCGLFLVGMTANMMSFSAQANEYVGDAQKGEGKVALCAACHGPGGNSSMPNHPSLAGQNAEYLYKQLVDFKLALSDNTQGRFDPVMSAQTGHLSDEDMRDIAAYFAIQEAEQGSVSEEVAEKGFALYMGGDTDRAVTACAACHGPNGEGMNLAKFPRINSQRADYTVKTLKDFRDGNRTNDPNGMMRDVAAKLTDAEIELLAEFLTSLY